MESVKAKVRNEACVSPAPPPKRQKYEGPVEIDAERLRCSTPQPQEEDGEDLDKSLEILGISHDSIHIFINESETDSAVDHAHNTVTQTENLENDLSEYAEDFLREVSMEEEQEQRRGMEVGGIPEVMEVILSQLPISHLYGSCRLVCRQWNDIIQREKFLYWKKLYYMYKSGRCVAATQTVTALASEVWPGVKQATLETVTVPLVSFVSDQFKDIAVSPVAVRRLDSHLHSRCVARIKELCPSIDNHQAPTCSAIATAVLLVMCSGSVSEVRTVLRSLLTSSPTCHDQVRVMELFYCLATLFCVGCEEMEKLPMRLHYNVFYALNLEERGTCGLPASELAGQPRSGQQSLLKYCEGSTKLLTAEQAQVVNYNMQPGEVIKVMAFAGTGKTTTLLKFTSLNPQKRFLYCIYNKSVQEHASSIFPPNVKCQTFHSLAHGSRGDPVAVGWKYYSKRGTLSSFTVSQSVDSETKRQGKQSLFLLSKQICETLEKFIASGDSELTDDHVPTNVKKRRNERMNDQQHREKVLQLRDPRYRRDILREARNIWQKMVDVNDKTVRMTDDGYLKVFQLSRPQVRGYDCILVDEAQDLTPAIISLITSQTCAKIFVGDPHQQIYGFRGATNALEQITANRVFHLTESFRFGPEIAYLAACTLSALKGIWRQTLVGSTHAGRIDGRQIGQVAVIARMNVTLFEEMVKTVRSGRPLKLGFAGGIQKYEFDMYLDIHRLRHGRRNEISHKFVKKWKDFNALAAFAERTDDVSLLNKIKICEKYAADLPKIIEKIKSMHSCDISRADIVFSTAHKSKGLEFDTVKLTDDYSVFDRDDRSVFDCDDSDDDDDEAAVLPIDRNTSNTAEIEERNLLYVAVTRAKKSVILTPTLARVLKAAKEYFVSPTMENSELREGVCSVCRAISRYPALRLQSVSLSDGPSSSQPISSRDGMHTLCSHQTPVSTAAS